ncbi:UNVERIFIED_CONTAM: hypothetical protein Sradi_7276500 [Sesamum radiatum]|uniref:Uncharacterized protein n=1 Tax=Sesamum radiatum TaxID=300843 RepID=A0AAW2IIZ6_SESRA
MANLLHSCPRGVPVPLGRFSIGFQTVFRQSLEGDRNLMGNMTKGYLPIHEWRSYSYGRPNAQVKEKVQGRLSVMTYLQATDRWPLVVLFEVFQNLFDRSFARRSEFCSGV